jgi:hypothetical protein
LKGTPTGEEIVNCGYKPPKLKGTSDPIMITFELMIWVGTLASGAKKNNKN